MTRSPACGREEGLSREAANHRACEGANRDGACRTRTASAGARVLSAPHRPSHRPRAWPALDLFIEHRHQGKQADGQHAVAAAGDLIREGAFRGWEACKGLVERVNGFRGLLLAMRLRQEPLRDFARGRCGGNALRPSWPRLRLAWTCDSVRARLLALRWRLAGPPVACPSRVRGTRRRGAACLQPSSSRSMSAVLHGDGGRRTPCRRACERQCSGHHGARSAACRGERLTDIGRFRARWSCRGGGSTWHCRLGEVSI